MSSTFTESLKRRKKYQFYKYRESWSSKITDWKTVRIPEGWDAKGFFEDMCHNHSWSEHFHGIESKKCKPTAKWLEAQVLDMRRRANEINEVADDYCWILHELKNKRGNRSRKAS